MSVDAEMSPTESDRRSSSPIPPPAEPDASALRPVPTLFLLDFASLDSSVLHALLRTAFVQMYENAQVPSADGTGLAVADTHHVVIVVYACGEALSIYCDLHGNHVRGLGNTRNKDGMHDKRRVERFCMQAREQIEPLIKPKPDSDCRHPGTASSLSAGLRLSHSILYRLLNRLSDSPAARVVHFAQVGAMSDAETGLCDNLRSLRNGSGTTHLKSYCLSHADGQIANGFRSVDDAAAAERIRFDLIPNAGRE